MDNHTNQLNKSLANLSLNLIVYFIVLLIEGKYRIELLNEAISSQNNITIIKISSNISMIITAVFAAFSIILILGICYFITKFFNLKISINSIINGFISIVLIFLIFQLLRLIIDIIFLKNTLSDLTYDGSFFDNLSKTKWAHYINFMNYFMLLIGTFVGGKEMYTQENRQNIIEISIISIVFFICYMIILL